MTINIELQTLEATKITGLTQNKDYFIQAYKILDSGKLIDTNVMLFKGQPQSDTIGLRDNKYAITANSDIYIKPIQVTTLIVVEEC